MALMFVQMEKFSEKAQRGPLHQPLFSSDVLTLKFMSLKMANSNSTINYNHL